MYFNLNLVKTALEELKSLHPFLGIVFPVCKQAKLPVGKIIPLDLARLLEQFFQQYYKPLDETTYYYRVFQGRQKKDGHWLEHNYPRTALTYTIARTFHDVLKQQKKPQAWGWQPNYIEALKNSRNFKPIPIFHLAVWLYRQQIWSHNTTPQIVVDTFLYEFNLRDEINSGLLDLTIPTTLSLQPQLVSWTQISQSLNIPPPPFIRYSPEVTLSEGRALAYLALYGVGPAKALSFSPSERLNLITGDNGLGKTFLLEATWWALTGQWAGDPAYPHVKSGKKSEISFQFLVENNANPLIKYNYDWLTHQWVAPQIHPTIPGLLIYARVDGSFAIWDSFKRHDPLPVLQRARVWNGKDNDEKTITFINGLVRDWVMWQNRPDLYPFEALKAVLKHLSPPEQSDLQPLEPGEPVRIPGDNKEIPTIKHSYGEIPISHVSAGVRQIITLAYLMVWSWQEHKIQAESVNQPPQHYMVIQIDEIEAHLHPQWQRQILPALLHVGQLLDPKLQIQFLITTHSPFVTASVETEFNPDLDKLFHLNIHHGQVVLEELDFISYGSIDTWLQSEVFELRQARSLEAENAIETAKMLQSQSNPAADQIAQTHERLLACLGIQDEFWPRWLYFAEQHGIQI